MKQLACLDLPVTALRLFPGNARKSDVKVIAESLRRNGQYRAIVVAADNPDVPEEGGIILAGNHTFIAATGQLGYTTIRCELIACDDDEARRINLADNRIPEKGSYDDDSLLALLSAASETGLEGTGWTGAELDKLAGVLPEPGDAGEDQLQTLFGVSIECDTESEQAALLERLSGEGLRVRALMR